MALSSEFLSLCLSEISILMSLIHCSVMNFVGYEYRKERRSKMTTDDLQEESEPGAGEQEG